MILMKKIQLYLSFVNLTSNELALKLNGFLMSCLPSDYADFLHRQETNPYSLTVIKNQDGFIWTVNLLNDEAIQKIGSQLLTLREIRLESYDGLITIQRIEQVTLTLKNLTDHFYAETKQPTFTVHFESPTSFKSQGEYVIIPNLRLIFQSLMQKYTRLVAQDDEIDTELLAYLDQHTRIVSYNLKTRYFTVHKQKIPAFQGKLTFSLRGAETLKSYVQMLLKFGEYSGVGIKTSLGMGGLTFEERRN